MSGKDYGKLFLSIVISVAGYSYFVSFRFGLILLCGLMFHEFGHFWQMGREGIKEKRMIAIPFLGAMAIFYEHIKSHWSGAKIALMGPTFGLATVIIPLLLFQATGKLYLLTYCFLFSMINLFNLAPLAILDGGNLVRPVLASFSIKTVKPLYWASYPLVMLLFFLGFSPLVVAMIGLWTYIDHKHIVLEYELVKEAGKEELAKLYFEDNFSGRILNKDMTGSQIALSVLWYFSLIVIYLSLILVFANNISPATMFNHL